MLHYLQEFSQKMISSTHKIQEQMNGLVHEAKVWENVLSVPLNVIVMRVVVILPSSSTLHFKFSR